MLEALASGPVKDWAVPKGIIEKEIDSISGFSSHDGWPSRKEYFIKGTEPVGEDLIHTNVKVCKGQEDKLATEAMVARGDYDKKEHIILTATDPAGGGKNRWQEGIDAWINKQGDGRYKYPKDYCGENDEIYIEIEDPDDKAKVDNDFTFKAKVTSVKDIKWVKFYVDGDKKKEISSKPYEYTQHLDKGSYTLMVKTEDSDGNVADREIKIGVDQEWDYEEPDPSPSASTSAIFSPLAWSGVWF